MTNFKKIKNIGKNLNTPAKKAKNVIKEKLCKNFCTKISEEHDLENSNIDVELIATLTSLLQADISAAKIYKSVLENIQNGENLYHELNSMRNDHLRHIDSLIKCIPDYSDKKTEITSIIWSSYAKLLGSIKGTNGFLKVLLSSEKKVCQLYSDAQNIKNNLDENLEQILIDNFEDEKNHIKYIEEQLNRLAEPDV